MSLKKEKQNKNKINTYSFELKNKYDDCFINMWTKLKKKSMQIIRNLIL